MPEPVIGRDCNNPHRGRPAYVSGDAPCETNAPSGELQTVVVPENPICGGSSGGTPTEPLTPACLTLTEAGIAKEVNYDEVTETYIGNNITGQYDNILGWTFTTNTDTYFPSTPSIDPVGVYATIAGQGITVVPCNVNTGQPVLLPDCVGVSVATDPFVVENFTKQSEILYLGDTSGATLNYNNGQWEYTLGGTTLYGPLDNSDVQGLYSSNDGQQNVVISDCNPDPEPEPEPNPTPICTEVKIASARYTVDTWSKNSDTTYLPDNPPLEGVDPTLEYDGTNWIYTEAGFTLTGPTDPSSPYGLYEAPDQTYVVFGPCS